jgi:Ring finger domain
MACIFSFALSVRAQQLGFRHEGVVIRREAPQRLTREQVDELLPEYSQGEQYRVVHQVPSSLGCEEACSICLDEYEPGDKCRCLPCGHKFHSGCICKWLTERSSTCPLCKTDLLQDEEEDNEYVELREGGTQTGDDFSEFPLGSIFARIDQFFSSARSRRRMWWRRRGQRRQQREQEGMMDEEVVSQQPLLEQSESED